MGRFWSVQVTLGHKEVCLSASREMGPNKRGIISPSLKCKKPQSGRLTEFPGGLDLMP